MIAHAFPPEGVAGVYRPLRFVRHMPSLGWQPTVITLDAGTYERYDPTLLGQVPDDIEVIRVRNGDPWQALLAKRNQRVQIQLAKAPPEQITGILAAQHNLM